MRRSAYGTLALGMLMGMETSADAQMRQGPGGALFANFVVADAVGPLGSVVDQGYGMELGAALPVGAGGHLRLRGDFGFSIYGLERIHYCGYGCRVSSTLTTANSIFYGDRLLTTGNPDHQADLDLLRQAGLSVLDPGDQDRGSLPRSVQVPENAAE